MRFIDFFSGIGGFRLGMEMAGHECVGHCEIDKFADTSYRAMHDVKESEWYAADIRSVKPRDLPEAEVYCFGFPCQSFSVAGYRRGFEDTRGTLFFEIMRLAKERQPKILFAENVKGLLNHDGGRTFATILMSMDELGYDVEWQVLDSQYFGVAQHRERVFIIGHIRGASGRKVFPIGNFSKETDRRNNKTECIGNINPSGRGMNGNVFSTNTISPTLTTNKGEGIKVAIPVLTCDRLKKSQNGRRFKENLDPMFTLTSSDRHGVCIYQKPRGNNPGGCKDVCPTISSNSWQENNYLVNDFKIRKLTPRECFRLQGFPDEYFDRAREVNSDSQLYKQAGNSVTVNVIYEIAKRL